MVGVHLLYDHLLVSTEHANPQSFQYCFMQYLEVTRKLPYTCVRGMADTGFLLSGCLRSERFVVPGTSF